MVVLEPLLGALGTLGVRVNGMSVHPIKISCILKERVKGNYWMQGKEL